MNIVLLSFFGFGFLVGIALMLIAAVIIIEHYDSKKEIVEVFSDDEKKMMVNAIDSFLAIEEDLNNYLVKNEEWIEHTRKQCESIKRKLAEDGE